MFDIQKKDGVYRRFFMSRKIYNIKLKSDIFRVFREKIF